jgi:hypothetical protein
MKKLNCQLPEYERASTSAFYECYMSGDVLPVLSTPVTSDIITVLPEIDLEIKIPDVIV